VTAVGTLQAALAVEHEVVYGYGVVGAWSGEASRRQAEQALAAHRLRRDALSAQIDAAGATPTPAAPGYPLPFTVDDETSAARLGARLENASAGAGWDLVAASRAGHLMRRDAVRWLSDSTRWLTWWRIAAGSRDFVALPGQPTPSS
jgi:hypothetical protein